MKNNQTFNILLLVAAGSSSRMGGNIKKEYLLMNGGTVLSNAAAVFLRTLPIDLVCVTYPFSDNDEQLALNEVLCKEALFKDEYVKNILSNEDKLLLVSGGKTRQESVFKALNFIDKKINTQKSKIVFIHDGARPYVSQKIITDCYKQCLLTGASVPALEPVDTQKQVDKDGFIVKHLNRNELASVQTPQVFLFDKILMAHQKANDVQKEFTDDSAIWDEFAQDSKKCKIVQGESTNKKITYPKDIQTGNKMIRVGIGYDKHLLVLNRKLIIGGVEIPFEKGEAGHSDGDALLHAIADALLGASAMGDIGSYFPSEDAKWKDSDSGELLKIVWSDIKKSGWNLENIDCVVALEKPKFLPYRKNVITKIAQILEVDEDKIFVKAKTGEKTGEIGEGKAIECFATCLLSKNYE